MPAEASGGRASGGLQPPWLIEAIDQAADLIFLTDERDRFVHVNRRCVDLLGIPPAKLVGEAVVLYVAPDSQAAMLDALRSARLGDPAEAHMAECRFVAKHAAPAVPLEVTVHPVTVGRRIVGCICVGRSIVERQDALCQRLASERVAAIGDLANRAADRINNPLAVLVTHVGIIERAAKEGKPADASSIEQMRKAITRIADETEGLATVADTSIQKLLLGRPIADLSAGPTTTPK